jgi:RNA polymerase sigma factor (sigma-70 family)
LPGDTDNPLWSDSAAVWDRLIEAVGLASLLAVIEDRLGGTLKRRVTAEDVMQETLLHAWRDRARHEWRGLKSFRNWLLTIADHRIHDLADQAAARKRGGDVATLPIDGRPPTRHGGGFNLPWESTTPSRIAVYREQAEAMRAASAGLPDELREVVRLRLFEQLKVEEIAERLHLGASAVRHRFRKGAELYQQKLTAELATRSWSVSRVLRPKLAADSSPEQ